MTTVLGVDVGWSVSTKTTGFAAVTIRAGIIVDIATATATVDDDDRWDAIQRVTRGITLIDGVGVDGPLLPGLIHDQAIPYRQAEAQLSKGPFQNRGKAGQSSSPTGRKLHEHATRLAHMVLKGADAGLYSIASARYAEAISERCVIEAFPTGFMSVMLPDAWHETNPTTRKDRGSRYWVASAGIDGPPHKCLEATGVSDPSRFLSGVSGSHKRDAVICAFSALGVVRDRYETVGDAIHGWIVLPDRGCWGDSNRGSGPWAADWTVVE